jgi:hypothetical protein
MAQCQRVGAGTNKSVDGFMIFIDGGFDGKRLYHLSHA